MSDMQVTNPFKIQTFLKVDLSPATVPSQTEKNHLLGIRNR